MPWFRSPATAAFTSALLVATLWGPAPARADLLQLRDGRFIEGVKLEVADDHVVIHYVNGDVKVPIDQVEDVLVEGAPPPETGTDEERKQRADGFVRYRGRWVRPEVRDRGIAAEVAERKKQFEEYKSHRLWRNRYEFSTKNFEFESTLPPEINDEYAELLETYFREFGKFWKTKVPKDWGKLKVCFYGSLEEFHKTGGVSGGVQAYYRFVEPRELDFFYDRDDPATSTAAMFHEANHYLTDLMDEKFQYPHWLNESLAEYYGASKWDPEKRTMVLGGVQDGRLVEVRKDISENKVLTLREIVSSEAQDYEHYYWGWSLVHFLLETPAYEKGFRKFFVDLATARDVERRPVGNGFVGVGGEECLRVFEKRLGVKDLEKLQSEWYAHIASIKGSEVRGKELGGRVAMRQGRYLRAERLLREALEAGSTSVATYVAYAQILERQGTENAKALAVLTRACEIAPLDSNTWAHRGYLLLTMGRKEEGRKLIALAKEIEPDNDFLNLEIAAKLAEVLGEEPK